VAGHCCFIYATLAYNVYIECNQILVSLSWWWICWRSGQRSKYWFL